MAPPEPPSLPSNGAIGPANPGRLEGWPCPLAPADLEGLLVTPATLEGLRFRPADLARLAGGKPDA